MNVILVNPPIRLPEVFAHYPTFSTLGLLGNAAWLRHKGHTVRVIDAFCLGERLGLRPDGKGVRHVGAEVEQVAAEVARVREQLSGPAVVVVALTMFSEMNRLRENLVPQAVRGIRAAVGDAFMGMADLYTCGMNYFPYDAVRVMEAIPEADFLLVGEGEPTLPELADRLQRAAPLQGLPRVAYRGHAGQVAWNPEPPEALAELDELPPPAFDLLDMERFFSAQADAIRADLVHEYHVVERQLALMTSRSCPHRCNFCTNQVLGLPWRSHSVAYVRALVRELRQRYQVQRFLFLDDNINVDLARFRELVHAMAEEGVPWDAVNGYRADRLDLQMVRAIKAAGNTKITVSAESGDPALLQQVIRKGLKLSSVIELARICEQERMPLQVHYIVGVPGETRTQINKTLEFATMLLEKHGAWPLLQHAIPFPGTRLFRDCEEHGWFVAPPFEIPGELLETESIIRTPDFQPQEVIRMKKNAQHLHAAMQALVYLPLGSDEQAPGPGSPEPSGDSAGRPSDDALRETLQRGRFLGGTHLLLGGGEPGLREDLAQWLALARSMGFSRITLLTNAWRLADAAVAAALAGAGLDALVVELHGAEAAVHDAATGQAGSFARTLQGVAGARRAGIALSDVRVAITTDSLAHLSATARLALGLGAGQVHLLLPEPDSRAAVHGRIPAWPQARDAVLAAVRTARRGVITVQGAPLCVLPEQPAAISPLPPWLLQRTRSHRARLPECLDCVGYVLCGGAWRPEHDATYGMAGLIRNPSRP